LKTQDDERRKKDIIDNLRQQVLKNAPGAKEFLWCADYFQAKGQQSFEPSECAKSYEAKPQIINDRP